MAVIRINWRPSQRELRWFGLTLLLAFGLIGGLVLWRTDSLKAAVILWSIGTVLFLVYQTLRPLRRPIYLCWMCGVFPIGWTVSHLVLAAVYYLVLTPLGLIMRWVGRDPMRRSFEPEAETYWIEHRPHRDPGRYFSQF